MPRLLLNDEHWSKLREILLHKAIYNMPWLTWRPSKSIRWRILASVLHQMDNPFIGLIICSTLPPTS